MRKSLVLVASFLAVIAIYGCATGDKKQSKSAGGPSSGSARDNNAGKERDKPSLESARRIPFINSFSNNSLTSQSYSKQKAENQIARLSDDRKNKQALESLLSAQRLAGRSADMAFNTAKRIADLEVDQNIRNQLDDDIKLELGLAAMAGRKFAMAEHFFDDIISSSKNVTLRAAAYNAMGVVALRDDRIPEAVAFFQQAIKLNDGFKAAKMNLGMLALKGGDFGLAKKELGDVNDDWMVQAALITVFRLEGNAPQVKRLCEKTLDDHPKHKPTMYNCALHAFQTERDFENARSIINKMVKTPGGPQSWDEDAYGMLTKIEFEKSRERQAKAARIAEEKRKDKEKEQQAKAKEKEDKQKPSPVSDKPDDKKN